MALGSILITFARVENQGNVPGLMIGWLLVSFLAQLLEKEIFNQILSNIIYIKKFKFLKKITVFKKN